jgi:hypothetical protein
MNNNHLAIDPCAHQVLRALFELARLDCPASAGVLASCLHISATQAARALLLLEERGLVRAECARLTMSGLATAARQPALTLTLPSMRGPLRVSAA